MPSQTASVAQISADDRHQALIGILNSGFHGISGDEPGNKHSLDGVCLEVDIGCASRVTYVPLPLAEFVY
jgi:hypothetical protein